MKITKQRLREIIREELAAEGKRTDMSMPALSMDDFHQSKRDRMTHTAVSQDDLDAAMATDDEKFTGGTHEERVLRRIKARELLAAMGKEELAALSKSLDAETVAELRHLLANPMYAPMEESITPGVQQLMKHHPHAAAKIKELAGNGYRASEIKRMLQLR